MDKLLVTDGTFSFFNPFLLDCATTAEKISWAKTYKNRIGKKLEDQFWLQVFAYHHCPDLRDRAAELIKGVTLLDDAFYSDGALLSPGFYFNAEAFEVLHHLEILDADLCKKLHNVFEQKHKVDRWAAAIWHYTLAENKKHSLEMLNAVSDPINLTLASALAADNALFKAVTESNPKLIDDAEKVECPALQMKVFFNKPENIKQVAQGNDLALFKSLLEHQLQEEEGRSERFQAIQEEVNEGTAKAKELLVAAMRYPALISVLEKPDNGHVKAVLEQKWYSPAVPMLAQKHYVRRPKTFLTLVPVERVVWCYENCWTEDLPAKYDDSLQRFLLGKEDLKGIVKTIGADALRPHLEKSFGLCVECYLKVPELKKTAADAICKIYPNLETIAVEERKVRSGYSFSSATLRVLEKLELLDTNFCGFLVYEVDKCKEVDRIACAVAHVRLCEDKGYKATLFEELGQLQEWEKYRLAAEIKRDPEILLLISKANLNLLWTVEDMPELWEGFKQCPEAIAYALEKVEPTDKDREVIRQLRNEDFFKAVKEYLPYELSGWKEAMSLEGDSRPRLEELHQSFGKGEAFQLGSDDKADALYLLGKYGVNLEYRSLVIEALNKLKDPSITQTIEKLVKELDRQD